MGTFDELSTERLREVLAEVDDAAASQRLMAAITYKEIDEITQKEVANMYGFSEGWASKWFNRLGRLADEPYEDVVYDKPRTGRPEKLSDDQREEFEAVLQHPPTEVSIEAPAWTVPLARNYLEEEFGVEYSNRHIRDLMKEAGLSWKTPRPKFEKADERAREAWQEGFKKSRTIWTTNTQS